MARYAEAGTVRGKIRSLRIPQGRGPPRGMMLGRIFPRALPPVGVTSHPWLAPPDIQLSYETNPFRSHGSDALFAPRWRERAAHSPYSAAGKSLGSS